MTYSTTRRDKYASISACRILPARAEKHTRTRGTVIRPWLSELLEMQASVPCGVGGHLTALDLTSPSDVQQKKRCPENYADHDALHARTLRHSGTPCLGLETPPVVCVCRPSARILTVWGVYSRHDAASRTPIEPLYLENAQNTRVGMGIAALIVGIPTAGLRIVSEGTGHTYNRVHQGCH